MTEQDIPLFPLNTVLFPDGLLPLRIFEPRYLDMIGRSMRETSPFGVVLIRSGREVGEAATPHPVGTLARVQDFDRGDDGLLNIVALGSRRFRVLSTQVAADHLMTARVVVLPAEEERPVPHALRGLEAGLNRLLDQVGQPFAGAPRRLDDAAWVSGRLAELLPLPLTTKQELLEMDDPEERLERIGAWVAKQVEEEGD